MPNCRDKSDEQQCELVKFEDGYNKKVPPITSVSSSNDSIVPVSVNVSIDLLKIVRMEEVEHLLELTQRGAKERKENANHAVANADAGDSWLG